jgi:glycosyltransferase involved in cell wall biosynthesis
VNAKLDSKSLRVAWLFPSLALGNYWHPVFKEFTLIYPQTTVFTGNWPGYSPGFEDAFKVKVVGKMTFVDMVRSKTGYSQGFINASPAIAGELLQFKPNIIFTSGFSIWTILTLLFKPLGGWRVVIVYDGSSPVVDYRHSKVRTMVRRIMSRFTNAFITNSLAGKTYLSEFLSANPQKIFAKPYQVPDATALLKQTEKVNLDFCQFQRPIFLFTGQIIPRKGLEQLLHACTILRDRGCTNYTLLIAGDGEQRTELEIFCKIEGLEERVLWLGWVNYGQLGTYFRHVDVLILPTLEDVWGMVVLEAMVFGKPVICSKLAGAAEMVIDGENGFLFHPQKPTNLAKFMQQMSERPELIASMGEKSKQIIAQHTPKAAVQFLAEVQSFVLNK